MAFHLALEYCEESRRWLLDTLGRRSTTLSVLIPVIVFSTIGAFVGWMTERFAPEAAGSGIPHLKGVLLHLRAMNWRRVLPVKFFGGALGIGAGLSLGREGPTVQLGAAVGAFVGEVLRVPDRSRNSLISCGAGAGLAAAFNAPLAGFLFVIEELHRELSAMTFGGAFVASVSADILVKLVGRDRSAFAIHHEAGMPASLLPLLIVLGATCGVLGVVFNKGLLFCSQRLRDLIPVSRTVSVASAAGIAGLVAWTVPDALGSGQLAAASILDGSLDRSTLALLVLLVAKFGLTLLSYGSGAPGGIFAPMLLLGATVGGILSNLAGALFPIPDSSGSAFAVLGMAAFFCASVRAPLTGIVLIVEMTGNYEHLLDICVACLSAYLVAEALYDTPIYDALLHSDLRRQGLLPRELDGVEPRSLVFVVEPGAPIDQSLLMDAGIPSGCLIVGIERSGREIMPRPKLKLLAGDQLTVLLDPGEERVLRLRELTRASG